MQPLEKNSNVSLVNQFRVSLNSVKFVLYDLKIKLMQKQKMLWVYWKCQRTIILLWELQLGVRILSHSAAYYYDWLMFIKVHIFLAVFPILYLKPMKTSRTGFVFWVMPKKIFIQHWKEKSAAICTIGFKQCNILFFPSCFIYDSFWLLCFHFVSFIFTAIRHMISLIVRYACIMLIQLEEEN